MDYSIRYHKDFRHLDEVSEIIIDYDKFKLGLLDFVKTRPQWQRIVIDIEHIGAGKDDYDIIAAAAKLHNRLAVRFDEPHALKVEYVREREIPFFFSKFIDTWDKLISCIEYGVTDVYIINELAFELDEVGKMCLEHSVNVRVFANVAQSNCIDKPKNTLTTFFIRPEDVMVYEQYVDTIEFFGPNDRMSVLYEIYKSQRWLGDLKDLILGLDVSLYSKHIVPYFGHRRCSCRKQCNQNKCHLCEGVLELSKELQERGIEIGIEKEKEPRDESEIIEKTMLLRRTNPLEVSN